MAKCYFRRTGWVIGIKLEFGRDFSVWHGDERIGAACRQDLVELLASPAPIFMDARTPDPEDNAGLDEVVWVFRVTNSLVGLRYRFVGPRMHKIREVRADRAAERRKAMVIRKERAEIKRGCGRGKPAGAATRRARSL